MGKHHKSPSGILFILSVVALIITAYVTFTGNDVFNIAGTQWMLVAIVLAVYSSHVHHCGCCGECKTDKSE